MVRLFADVDLSMTSPPVWLPGPMFLPEGSLCLVPCSFQGQSFWLGLCLVGLCLRSLSWGSFSGVSIQVVSGQRGPMRDLFRRSLTNGSSGFLSGVSIQKQLCLEVSVQWMFLSRRGFFLRVFV